MHRTQVALSCNNEGVADDGRDNVSTTSAGSHTHVINGAGNHNHTMVGAGGHNHTIGDSGGSETRPRNVALMYIIRY